MSLPHHRRSAVLLFEEDHRVATAMATLLRAHGFAVAVTETYDDLVTLLNDAPEATVVLSCSTSGIGTVTSSAVALRRRPETSLQAAGIIALVDHVSDAAFGLRTEADQVLLRPVPLERLITTIGDIAAAQPTMRAKLRSVA